MINKEQAMPSFWAGFGWDAYDENTVPDDAKFPYITYSSQSDGMGNVLHTTASLWDKTTSWARISQKLNDIAKYMSEDAPVVIPVDSGYVYITKGTPFAQRMREDSSDLIRRILLNVNVEYLTEY